MQDDEVFVAGPVDLDGALGEQPGRVGPREQQLAAALQQDESKNRVKDGHGSPSTTNPALKPGPSAVSKARPSERPASRISASIRSSTNITDAADMLP